MVETLGRRRKKAKRSKRVPRWTIFAAVGLVIVGFGGWYVYSKILPAATGPLEVVESPQAICSLEDFIEEAYGSKTLIGHLDKPQAWERTPRGKRFVTPKGSTFEIEYLADRAVDRVYGASSHCKRRSVGAVRL